MPRALGASPPHISSLAAGKSQNASLPMILGARSRVTEQMHHHKCHLLFDRHPVHDPTDISPPSALHLHHWTNDAFLDQPLRCGFLAEHTILFHHAVCDATLRRDQVGTKLCAFTMLGASTAKRLKHHAKTVAQRSTSTQTT